MFTIDQINEIHGRLDGAKTLLQYVQAIEAIGVVRADSYVSDGHSEYFSEDGQKVESSPVHDVLSVSQTSSGQSLLQQLRLHDEGKTSYLEMSKGLAESGIEKWVINTLELTMSFYDAGGNKLLTNKIV